MKAQTLNLLIVGIVSSVAAWGITSLIDRMLDKRSGYNERGRLGQAERMPRTMRRNRMLAGIGGGAVMI